MIFLRLGGVQQPAGVEALKREDVGALPLVSVRGSTNEASEAANETTGFFENTRSRGASEPLRLTGEPNSGTSVGSATLMRQVNVTFYLLFYFSHFSPYQSVLSEVNNLRENDRSSTNVKTLVAHVILITQS